MVSTRRASRGCYLWNPAWHLRAISSGPEPDKVGLRGADPPLVVPPDKNHPKSLQSAEARDVPKPMATRKVANPNSSVPKDLKRTFEAALGELRGEEVPDRKAKTPIYRRQQEVATSADASPEQPKRALADAADALAALWKTSSGKGSRRS